MGTAPGPGGADLRGSSRAERRQSHEAPCVADRSSRSAGPGHGRAHRPEPQRPTRVAHRERHRRTAVPHRGAPDLAGIAQPHSRRPPLLPVSRRPQSPRSGHRRRAGCRRPRLRRHRPRPHANDPLQRLRRRAGIPLRDRSWRHVDHRALHSPRSHRDPRRHPGRGRSPDAGRCRPHGRDGARGRPDRRHPAHRSRRIGGTRAPLPLHVLRRPLRLRMGERQRKPDLRHAGPDPLRNGRPEPRGTAPHLALLARLRSHVFRGRVDAVHHVVDDGSGHHDHLDRRGRDHATDLRRTLHQRRWPRLRHVPPSHLQRHSRLRRDHHVRLHEQPAEVQHRGRGHLAGIRHLAGGIHESLPRHAHDGRLARRDPRAVPRPHRRRNPRVDSTSTDGRSPSRHRAPPARPRPPTPSHRLP